ncbi:response regulator [Rufibacter immobilis]|uniref:response regulator n=1 Tax=Rufibacter immobilis TaxID=1348778 RepID=UPI0035EE293D
MQNSPYPHSPAAMGQEKPSILFVDDEEDNLVVFRSMFRRHFKVFTAMSGEEGLRILNSEDISLVITDQRMPKMTGIQFLKNLPPSKDAIRIILTGYSDMDSALEAINHCQVYRYLLKPWDKEELKTIMEGAVEEHRQRRAHRERVSVSAAS